MGRNDSFSDTSSRDLKYVLLPRFAPENISEGQTIAPKIRGKLPIKLLQV
jgi:hypothetical protein